MADYIVNVVFNDKDTINALEQKYNKAKAKIEGEQLKVRITDDPKDLEELQNKIKSLSASKVSQLHLSVDRKGFAEQLDAMKKYTENTSQEIAGVFKKNVQKGIEGFTQSSMNKTAKELYHEFGGGGNFSKGNLQKLIGQMAEATKGDVNGDRTYISIVKQAEAFEKLSMFLSKIKSTEAKNLQGIKDAIGFDPTQFGKDMKAFYSSVDKMMFDVDINKKWQGEIEKSFQTLVENIAAVQESILKDVKVGMGSGNGKGGGFGGELSEEGKKIQQEIDDYTNSIREATEKLKKAQEDLEKIKNTKDTLGGKLNLLYKDYTENSYKWDDKKTTGVEKQLFAMMTAYKDKGGSIPKNIQKLYGDFQKRFKTPDMSLIPDLNSEIELAKKNIDQIQSQLSDLEAKKKQAEERLQQIMSGGGTGSGGTSDGSGAGGSGERKTTFTADTDNFDEAIAHIKEKLEEIPDEKKITFTTNSEGFDEVINNIKKYLEEIPDEKEVTIKTNTGNNIASEKSNQRKRFTYHYGDISSNGKLSHQFGDEISAWFSGIQNGGRGWSDGTGTYVSSDYNQYKNGDFSDPLKQFYAIDTSNLKLYEAHTEEAAEKYYNFIHQLEQFCIKVGSGFSGFDSNLNDVDTKTLYNLFQDVFSDSKMTFEEFSNFIDDMTKLVQEAGLKADGSLNAKKMFDFKKKNGSDDIKTRFMKMLGFQGSDLSGTSFDSLRDGSVLFDTANVKENIIKTGKTIEDVIIKAEEMGDKSEKVANDLENQLNAKRKQASEYSDAETPGEKISFTVDTDNFDETIAHIKEQLSSIPEKQEIEVTITPNIEGLLDKIKEGIADGISVNLKPVWTTGNSQKQTQRSKEETHQISRKRADGTEVTHTTKTSTNTESQTDSSIMSNDAAPRAVSSVDSLKTANTQLASAAQQAGNKGASAMEQIADSADRAVRKVTKLKSEWDFSDLMARWDADNWSVERASYINTQTGKFSKDVRGTNSRRIQGKDLAVSFADAKAKDIMPDYILHTHPESQSASLSISDIDMALSQVKDGIRGIISIAGDEIAKIDVKSLVDNGFDFDKFKDQWLMNYNKLISDMTKTSPSYTDLLDANDNINKVLTDSISDSLKEFNIDIKSSEISNAIDSLVKNLSNSIENYSKQGKEIVDFTVIDDSLYGYIENFVRSIGKENVGTKNGISLSDIISENMEGSLFWSHPQFDTDSMEKYIKNNPTLQQSLSAKALRQTLTAISGEKVDLSKFFTVQSRDDFLKSIGLTPLHVDGRKFEAESNTSDIRGDIEKALDEPFDIKTKVSDEQIQQDVQEEFDKPIEPKVDIDGSSLREIIQQELTQPFEVQLQPADSLRTNIEKMLADTFNININVDGVNASSGGNIGSKRESPSEIISQMLKADAWMQQNFTGEGTLPNGKKLGPLKERAMYFSSKTGYHTNPFIFDRQSSMSDYKIIDSIPKDDLNKYQVDSQMHSHPEKYAFMSIDNYDKTTKRYSGDLSAFLQRYVENGIKNQVIAAQKDVQVFDFDSFVKDNGKLFGDVDSNGVFKRNDKKEQDFIEKFSEKRKSFYENMQDDLDIMLELRKVVDDDSIFRLPVFNSGNMKDFMNANVLQKAVSSFSNGHSTKEYNDHFWKYVEENKDNIQGGIEGAIKQYIGDAFKAYSQGAFQGREKKLNESYNDIMQSFDRNYLDSVISELFNTRSNGDPFDVAYKLTSLKAFKSMGVDFSKYNQFMSLDEFEHFYDGANTSTGFVPKQSQLDVDFDDVSTELQAAIDKGSPYKIDVNAEFDGVSDKLQQDINEGSPYRVQVQLDGDKENNKSIDEIIGAVEKKGKELLGDNGARRFKGMMNDSIKSMLEFDDSLANNFYSAVQNSQTPGELHNIISVVHDISKGYENAADSVELFNKILSDDHQISDAKTLSSTIQAQIDSGNPYNIQIGVDGGTGSLQQQIQDAIDSGNPYKIKVEAEMEQSDTGDGSGQSPISSGATALSSQLNSVAESSENASSKFREYSEEVAIGMERIARADIVEKAGLTDGTAFEAGQLGNGSATSGIAYSLMSASDSLWDGLIKRGLLADGSSNFSGIREAIEQYVQSFLNHFNLTIDDIKSQLSDFSSFDSTQFGFKPHNKTGNEKGSWQHFHSIDENGHSTDKFEGDYTYKAYARFADPRMLNVANIQSIMKALSDAGFKGQVKIPGISGVDRVTTSSDQLVIHGINSEMQKLAYELLRNQFGNLFSSLKAGFDKTKTTELDGASFSEILVNKGRKPLIEDARKLLQQQQSNETPVLKSPSQTFDNEVQQNLVSLENYKNTIAEIDKLKLEPETEETKAKLEELNTLADYFASKITTIRGEGGSIDGTFMKDSVTGGFTQRLRSKYTDEQLTQMKQVARERYGVSSRMETPQFTKIGSELSNIEAKSEGMRQSLNKSLLESSSYVKQLEKSFIDLIQLNLELKVETNKKDIEDYQNDMNEILSKYPQLQQFIDQFSTEKASWEFVKTDKWNDFLSTLPQAHAYLENLGYDFEKINKKDSELPGQDTSSLRKSLEESSQTAEKNAGEEASAFETLLSKIREVSDAVDIKTNRFREEGEVVTGVVQSEMTMLDRLLGEVNIIVQDLDKLSSAIKSLPEIELKMKEIGEGSTINAEMTEALDRIKTIFQDFNTENINAFTEALKGIKFSDANVKSIENLAAAIELLVEQMNRLNEKDFSSGMFSSINELLSHSEELKNLASILKESTEKIKAATKSTGKQQEQTQNKDASNKAQKESNKQAADNAKEANDAQKQHKAAVEELIKVYEQLYEAERKVDNSFDQSKVDDLRKRKNELYASLDLGALTPEENARIKRAAGNYKNSKRGDTLSEEISNQVKIYQAAAKEYSKMFSAKQRDMLPDNIDIEKQAENLNQLYDRLKATQDEINEAKQRGVIIDQKAEKALEEALKQTQSNIEQTVQGSNQKTKIDALYKSISSMEKQSSWRTSGWDKAIQEAKEGLKELVNFDFSQNDSMAKFEQRYNEIIARIKAAQKNVEFLPAKDTWASSMSAKVETWMNTNKIAAKEFRDELDKVRAAIKDVDNEADASNVENMFNEVVAKAQEGGFTGKSLGDRFKDQFKNTMTSLATYYLSFQDFIRYGREAINIIVELDTAMTNLKKVADDSATSFDKFRNTAFDIAKETGSTATGVIDAATEWARLGYSLEDSAKLSKASVIYSNVGEIDATQATTDLVSVLKAFKMDSEDALHAVDVLNEIGI